jgi:integrase/recombinase XerD
VSALIPYSGAELPALESGTLAELRTWLESQRSKQTLRAYQSDMRQFLSFLAEGGITELRDIRAAHVVHYRRYLKEERGLAASSIARKLSAVRSMLDYCISAGLLTVNPAKAVKSYRVSDVSPRHALSSEQVRALFAAPDRRSIIGARDFAMLMMLAYLGPRRMEVSSIRCGQFFRERGHVVLRIKGKGDKTRLLPVPARVQEALKAYLERDGRSVREIEELERRGEEPLFLPLPEHAARRRGETVNEDMVWRRVTACAREAGLSIDVHTLRHTALTAALDGGAPLRRVQAMAGHSDPKTTARYDSRRESLDDAAVYRVSYE